MPTRPWPFPQDTALDRARTIARELAKALAEAAPEVADELLRTAREFGEEWVSGSVSEQAGLLDTETLAQRLGVRPGTVRSWASRGVGPGASRGEGRRLTRYPGGFDPVEAEELLVWARTHPDDTGSSD